ncbi:hypothetical protein [Angustibacter luteus]|uniref:Uncharacterized protein n=1 Tax=Angustibacter luteus TaxID=658456 RepID=A0ABW1JE51_9ACTN
MTSTGQVDLYWLPLGAGERSGCVRWNGRLFESIVARRTRRMPSDLYHSALEIHLDDVRFTIEMTPVWGNGSGDRGVVATGPVGLRALGRSRFFRYEVRCWRGGSIPDLAEAAGGRRTLRTDPHVARRVLDLVSTVPTATWGRDELGTGDMWNSNSLTSWLIASAGIGTDDVAPPLGGRAPGWTAGLAVARRGPAVSSVGPTPTTRSP